MFFNWLADVSYIETTLCPPAAAPRPRKIIQTFTALAGHAMVSSMTSNGPRLPELPHRALFIGTAAPERSCRVCR